MGGLLELCSTTCSFPFPTSAVWLGGVLNVDLLLSPILLVVSLAWFQKSFSLLLRCFVIEISHSVSFAFVALFVFSLLCVSNYSIVMVASGLYIPLSDLYLFFSTCTGLDDPLSCSIFDFE